MQGQFSAAYVYYYIYLPKYETIIVVFYRLYYIEQFFLCISKKSFMLKKYLFAHQTSFLANFFYVFKYIG